MKELLDSLIDKYQDWHDTAESDDWTTRNLCLEVIVDLKDLSRGK